MAVEDATSVPQTVRLRWRVHVSVAVSMDTRGCRVTLFTLDAQVSVFIGYVVDLCERDVKT